MPVSDDQFERLKIEMVVFSLDNWILNVASLSDKSLRQALIDICGQKPDIYEQIPTEFYCTKQVLQYLASNTSFPRNLVEKVFHLQSKYFKLNFYF